MEVFKYILYILLAIVILLLMVVIHEFGHYIAGKLLKFKINEFAVGFGPKIFSKTKKNGEVFSLRAIPLGGYCAFEGEESDEGVESGKAFVNEKPWKRIIVFLAGAVFNLISAVIFSFIFILAIGFAVPTVAESYVQMEPVSGYLLADDKITAVDGVVLTEEKTFEKIFKEYAEGESIDLTIMRKNAELTVEVVKAKTYNPLINGDEILAVNGKKITVLRTYEDLIAGYELGDKVTLSVLRGGQETQVSVTKRNVIYVEAGEASGKPQFKVVNYDGFGYSSLREYKKAGVGSALAYSVPFTGKLSWTILGTFGKLFTGQIPLTDLAGPVGTVTQIADLSHQNWRNILILLPLIASNLAVFNLLPIPALDGSKVVFTTIEWIRGKPINRKAESIVHLVGILTIFALVIIIDLVRLIL